MRPLLLVFVMLGACADGDAPDDASACPVTCDDGDPCTDDRCDQSTFACVHVAREVLDACREDRHCDDGDSCTDDRCVAADGCPALLRCEHAWLPACEPCLSGPFGCDDGVPCTDDWCDDGARCHHDAVATCDPRCNAHSAVLPSGDLDQAVAVTGFVQPRDGLECDGCPCQRDLALADDEAQVMVRGLEIETCTMTCDGEPACGALSVGRWYLVYGQVRAGANASVAADGWCMELDKIGLWGDYDAVLTLDAEPAPLRFWMEAGRFEFAVRDTTRLVNVALPDIRDGVALRLELDLDGRPIEAHLFPGHNVLEGPVVATDSGRIGALRLDLRR